MELLHVAAEAVPFPGSSGSDLFDQLGQLRTIARHGVIYGPGDTAELVYRIVAGEVKLSRYTPEGREFTLDHLTAGEIFGEQEILLECPRESQATARTDVTVQVVERDALLGLARDDQMFGLWLARFMGARQSRMESRLESLLFKSANGKVAQVLVNLAREHGLAAADGVRIDYPITHQEIGNLIATTRETVSYAFMEFRQRGLISTRQRKTVVHDMDALAELALT